MIDKSRICYDDRVCLFLSSATEFMNAANEGRISKSEGRNCLIKLSYKIKGKDLVSINAENHILAFIQVCHDDIKDDELQVIE